MKISTGMSHVVLPANTYIFFFSFPKYILLIDIVSYPFENLIELKNNRWACLKMSAVDTEPVKIRLQIKWSSHGWSHDYRIRPVLRNSWWTLAKGKQYAILHGPALTCSNVEAQRLPSWEKHWSNSAEFGSPRLRRPEPRNIAKAHLP